MNVGYNSVFDNIITFDADSTLESANVLVTLTDDGKAKKAGAGDDICAPLERSTENWSWESIINNERNSVLVRYASKLFNI